MKKTQKLCLISLLVSVGILSACGQQESQGKEHSNGESIGSETEESSESGQIPVSLKYKVDPETFQLELWEDGKEGTAITVSDSGTARQISDLSELENSTSWTYPQENLRVEIQPVKDYLEVSISSTVTADNTFSWPVISGDVYYIPFGEGKRIPSNDAVWKDYLLDEKFSVIEQLSMPFFASVSGDNNQAAVYIMEQPFRSDLSFYTEQQNAEKMGFTLNHEYPEIDPEKEQSFRIYLTAPDAASIAKKYRSYVMEQGKFVSLEEKAEENPNIKKLYGAPHVYFWNDRVISEEDVDWKAFKKQLSSPAMTGLTMLWNETEEGKELQSIFSQLSSQEYIDNYQKKVIVRELSSVLKRKDFYRAFAGNSGAAATSETMEHKNLLELIKNNKRLLAENMPEVFTKPVSQWADSLTVDVIQDMKASGIEEAFIGLDNWDDGFGKPELVEEASNAGYLVGPYDSYHSIHEPGNEQWNTAAFPDASLYDTATVTDKSGKKIAGFQNVGRKLNPVLSIPYVKERVKGILDTGLPFNAWFIDCDGTGEIYDDYTKEHVTTMQQDLEARMQRMAYLAKDNNMVVGTEGGNDLAAGTAAFAHGIELQSFSWMDEDMKANKDSEYYLGRYYSADGGVPEKFGKPVLVKDKYRSLFLDMQYQVPLYGLVYHDSMIISYHWDWSTLKIKGEEENRMLREVLYQVPPLYHLDKNIWDENKEIISTHAKEWGELHKLTAQLEMTDFKRISEDGLVQMTKYGNSVSIFANFTESDYAYEDTVIPAGDYLIVKE